MAWQRLLVCGKTTPLMILPCVWAQGFGCTHLCLCKNSHNQMCSSPKSLSTDTADWWQCSYLSYTSRAQVVFSAFIEAGYGRAFNNLCNRVLAACNCSDGVNWGGKMFSWTPLGKYNFPLTSPRGSTVFFWPHSGCWNVLITCHGADRFALNIYKLQTVTHGTCDAFYSAEKHAGLLV